MHSCPMQLWYCGTHNYALARKLGHLIGLICKNFFENHKNSHTEVLLSVPLSVRIIVFVLLVESCHSIIMFFLLEKRMAPGSIIIYS